MSAPDGSGSDNGLKSRLLRLFAGGADTPLDDSEFDELALAVFAHQLKGSTTYAAYCKARGATLESVERWTDIPAVPTRAFKALEFNAHPKGQVATRFKTSGTTAGAAARGTHVVADLELYRASLLPTFARYLLPEGRRMPMVCLALSPEDHPTSSLSHMLGVVAGELVELDGYYVDPDTGLDQAGAESALRRYSEANEPVLLAGTAFTFVHFLDAMANGGRTLALPGGSRIMETGGFKGRSREVARPELYAALEQRLRVPSDHVVNEYGMTELLSQYYEPVLLGRARRHVAPPWLRPRIVDPSSLAPVPQGQAGLIQHFDLANLHSVSAVLTEDLGILHADGLELLGRATDAEPRGCSIAMDDLLAVRPS